MKVQDPTEIELTYIQKYMEMLLKDDDSVSRNTLDLYLRREISMFAKRLSAAWKVTAHVLADDEYKCSCGNTVHFTRYATYPKAYLTKQTRELYRLGKESIQDMTWLETE